MRTNSPIDRLYDFNDGALRVALDEIKWMTMKERGEDPVPVDTRPTAEDDTHAADLGFYVAVQSKIINKEELGKAPREDLDVVREYQEMASKYVTHWVRLIDASLPAKEVVNQLRLSHVGKLDSTTMESGSVLIWYDVKASGEDAKRPAHRRPVFRKKHLDKMMSNVLESRSAPEGERLTQLPAREVVLLFDACREGNSAASSPASRWMNRRAKTLCDIN
jgi:hypothetical protein